MPEHILSNGTVTIQAKQYNTYPISTGITDPSFFPIISITPVDAMANVSAHLSTDLQYSSGEWKFRVARSIGNTTNNNDTGAESMTFFWKVIAIKPVKEIGHAVTPASEAFEQATGGGFGTP